MEPLEAAHYEVAPVAGDIEIGLNRKAACLRYL